MIKAKVNTLNLVWIVQGVSQHRRTLLKQKHSGLCTEKWLNTVSSHRVDKGGSEESTPATAGRESYGPPSPHCCTPLSKEHALHFCRTAAASNIAFCF